MSDTDHKVRIPTLTGSNYLRWSFTVNLVLRAKKLLEAIQQDLSNGNSAALEIDAQAMAIIATSCDDKRFEQILTCKSARAMWLKLECYHSQQSTLNKTQLLQDFHTFAYDDNDTVATNIARLEHLALTLANAGEVISGPLQIAKLLFTLPSRFDHLRSAWDNLAEADKTLDLLTTRLLTEETRLNNVQTSGNSAALAAASSRDQKRKDKSDNKSKTPLTPLYCNFCKIWCKHTEKECRKKAAAAAGGNNSNNNNNDSKSKDHKNRQPDSASGHAPSSSFVATSISTATALEQSQPTFYEDLSSDGDIQTQSSAFAAVLEPAECHWISDSGASEHMTYRREWFTELRPIPRGAWPIRAAGNSLLYAAGVGTINISAYVNGETVEHTLTNVLYVPSIGMNLFSIAQADERGFRITYENKRLNIYKGRIAVLTGFRHGKTYRMLFKACQPDSTAYVSKTWDENDSHLAITAESIPSELQLWHERLGHPAFRTVKELANSGAIKLKNPSHLQHEPFCKGCALGRPHANSHSGSITAQPGLPGEEIHADLQGPMSVASVSGSLYAALFVCPSSGLTSIRFLKTKRAEETLSAWQSVHVELETLTGSKVRRFRTDNGNEFDNQLFRDYNQRFRIQHTFTAPYSPEQNGVAERANRTIMETSRCLLYANDLPRYLWAELMHTAVYLRNRLPRRKLEGKSPLEVVTGKPPKLGHLRIIGSKAYALNVGPDKGKKLDARATLLTLIGYSVDSPAYRLFDSAKQGVVTRHDVTFEERPYSTPQPDLTTSFPNQPSSVLAKEPLSPVEPASTVCDSNPTPAIVEQTLSINHAAAPTQPLRLQSATLDPVSPPHSDDDDSPDEDSPEELEHTEIPSRRYPERVRKIPGSWWIGSAHSAESLALAVISDDPLTRKEALSGPDRKLWEAAMDDEFLSLEENHTWDLVSPPTDQDVLTGTWVLKTKYKSSGVIDKRKARWVAHGYKQVEGIDFNETFAPVVSYPAIRIVLAVAALRGLRIKQFDVKTAFLNGEIKERVYIKQPTGYEVKGKEHLVCRLHRSLYGLKQSPRCWNEKFNDFLVSLGFTRSSTDLCIYSATFDSAYTIICLYVDDGLILSESDRALDKLHKSLASTFKCTFHHPDTFVGLNLNIGSNGTVRIDQSHYAKKIVSLFNLDNAAPVSTPADPNVRLLKATDSDEIDNEFPYRTAIGSLLFLARGTRPDISFAVAYTARFCEKPTNTHVTAVKRIIRYIKGTLDLGITFSGGSRSLITYCDSDYAGDINTRKSTNGFVIAINNAPISWNSELQKSVSLSTTEAEYVAISNSAKELIWIRHILNDLQHPESQPSLIRSDNQSAISLLRNPVFHKRTKHIDVRYHFARDLLTSQIIDIDYVNTTDQIADLLTKGLASPQFARLRSFILQPSDRASV